VKRAASTVRERFVARLPYELDAFQVEALDALDRGDSVVVAAPTGSGKTVVAEYAVELALARSGKVFYTTPLKALSNQKYGDFCRRYGSSQVGLLTGDNSLNGDAAVVVMTTEVLRNMIYARSTVLEGLRYVVLDEVHYLQDPYRGSVWEEVIVHLAHEVDLVCLSATVSNAEELADWVRTVRGSTTPVICDRRPVPLQDLLLVGDRSSRHLALMPVFAGAEPNPEAAALTARPAGPRRYRGRGLAFAPSRAGTVELLAGEGMVPAIYFIFSRAGCEEAVRQCAREVKALTTASERRQIRLIAEAATALLPDDDLRALGYGSWLAGLEAGFAAHHAGLVPAFKEAVERCFEAGLVKVVFATETLALGINMPARSVVVERLAKWNGERTEPLTPGEYTQLTGRAGRRGTDTVGYSVVNWSPGTDLAWVAALAKARTYTLTSSFRPTYNMAANLVQRYSPEAARHLLNLSFAQYRADSDVVRLEAYLDSARRELAESRAGAACELGDIWEYRAAMRASRHGGRHNGPGRAHRAEVVAAMERLRPGDVLVVPGHRRAQGEVAVLSTKQRKKGDLVVTAVTSGGRLVSFSAAELRSVPSVARRLKVARLFAPKSREFQSRLAAQLSSGASSHQEGEAASAAGVIMAGYPVSACPQLRAHLRAAARAERAAKRSERLERQLRGRRESVAHQFDQVLALLEGRHYVKLDRVSWGLTDAGRRLARIYHDQDLLIAECAGKGLFDGLRPVEMAALASVFTYEPRGNGARGGPSSLAVPGLDGKRLQARWRAIEPIAMELAADEEELGLPPTRSPHPGFAGLAYGWARGRELSQLLGPVPTMPTGEAVPPGDFVRNVKQLIDLLRQLGDVLAGAAAAQAAREASQALLRGVVAASSVLGTTEEGSVLGTGG